MNKTNIKCPRCHSDQLYKFGMDKQANQKYQCKKFNNVIVQYYNTIIDLASSVLVSGSLSMKGMRFPLNTILTLYFLNNSSTRAIAQFLWVTQNIKVSYVTIARQINLLHFLS